MDLMLTSLPNTGTTSSSSVSSASSLSSPVHATTAAVQQQPDLHDNIGPAETNGFDYHESAADELNGLVALVDDFNHRFVFV
jgi:hypothetical protein